MKSTPIIVTNWTWRKDFAPNFAWSAIVVAAAVGKYHLGINGAANIFAAMCALYAFVGLVLFFATPTTYLMGNPWLVRVANRSILLALIAATAWFGDWWLFSALVASLAGVKVHHLKAEKLHADQQAA